VIRQYRLRRLAAAFGVVLASVALAACGSSSATSTPSSTISTGSSTTSASATSHYPVTIENCGTKVTFDSAPTRAVSNDINTTEDMLALGLAHSMVGYFGATGDEGVTEVIPPEYQTGLAEVRNVSPNYFTLEPLVGLTPDFVFAGYGYGLQAGTRLSPEGLAKFGIKTLALSESCDHVQKLHSLYTITDTYQDIANLGEIFNVNARAQQVIAQMKAQIASVQAKVSRLKPVTVFDYDSGTSAPTTAGGLATPQAEIQLAGGTNIFANLNQSFSTGSWEQVVKAQPQCIIINDYGTPTAAQKLKFLRTFPAAKNLPAVRNNCILPLGYDEITPGTRDAEAVVALAKLLHPTAFGLPARS
jgi:iron complex transport system substrate-binding protein